VWIGVKLLLPTDDDEHGNIQASDKLWGAVKTVIVADLVMSIDNVIAIAGAAQGAAEQHQMPLVIFGLLVSIPIIIWGSQLVLKLMDRFPMIITLGAALLGYIAGGLVLTDPAVTSRLGEMSSQTVTLAGLAGAALVVLLGRVLARRQKPATTD
jgi:YjbE family integral membrane protein